MLRIFFLIIGFSGLAVALQAQNDSQCRVLAAIRVGKPDTNRGSLLLKVGCYHLFKWDNEEKDLDSAFSFFKPALVLSRALHDEKCLSGLPFKIEKSTINYQYNFSN